MQCVLLAKIFTHICLNAVSFCHFTVTSNTGDGDSCSLKSVSSEIERSLREALQSRIEQAGCICQSFRLNEVSFAPEISAMMLKRQAAKALVQVQCTEATKI